MILIVILFGVFLSLPFVGFFMTVSLRHRVARLEALLEGKEIKAPSEQQLPNSLNTVPLSSQEILQVRPVQTPSQPRPVVVAGPSVVDRFASWLAEDWLVKLGAFLLILATGWFVSLAFSNKWIGPVGQIALGILGGTSILILGFWRMQKYQSQGSIFLVLGSTTVILSVFAARVVYGFFDPLSSLAIMFLASAFVGVASVMYNNRALALTSLILAGVVPFLTNSPTADYVGLFAYLFVVILGAIWIVVLTGQRVLTAAALGLVFVYSLIGMVSDQRDVLLYFAYAFAGLFFITNTAGILKAKKEDSLPDLYTAVGNGLFLLWWITSVVPQEWQSLTISAWMVVFLSAAFAVFNATSRKEPFYAYGGVGIAMLAAATAAELQGPDLTIAYTIETAMICAIGYLLTADLRVARSLSALFWGPVILSLPSVYSNAWRDAVVHSDFFVLMVLGTALSGVGLFLVQKAREQGDKEMFGGGLVASGSLYYYAILWLTLHVVFPDDIAVMFALFVYTIIGIGTYLYGARNEIGGMRIYGGAMLGFVVARLLFVDVWKMALIGRTLTFFAIGALLMSTAFVRKNKQIK